MRKIFTCGTARGGTNLFTNILNVNNDVQIAQDPFLGIWKSFRDSIVRNSDIEDFQYNSPLGEYYYCEKDIYVMKMVQNSNLSNDFDNEERNQLLDNLERRIVLSSPLLKKHLHLIKGSNYKEIVESSLEVVKAAWNAESKKVIGINENWIIEFFPCLAKAFPDARILICGSLYLAGKVLELS